MFFSIRYKFLAITLLLLLASTLTFLFLAVDLFNSDKKAYIYDNNAALVDSIAEEINTSIQSVTKTLNLVGLAYTQPNSSDETKLSTIKDLFQEEDSLVDLAIYPLGEQAATPLIHIVNDTYLAPFKLDKGYLERVHIEKPVNVKNVLSRGVVLQNSSLPDGMPMTMVSVVYTPKAPNSPSYLLVANMHQDKLLQMFKRTAVYSIYLVDRYANLLAHRDFARTMAGENLSQRPIIHEIISSEILEGVREYTNEHGKSFITAYRKLDKLNLIVLSELPAEKAYAASARLIEKSVLFAALILMVVFVVSILFTRRLTAAIQRLYRGTERIAQGDFSTQVQATSHDEVGALATSFNKMTGEITRLMQETADKARMEKELETAQIVQDSFFPPDFVAIENFEIASYYKPSSECGGDWWGYFRIQNSLIVMLGDATGHGVGPALITAAARSCASVLEWLHSQNTIQNISASTVMSSLNAAVYHTGCQKVKMTFFVAMIDLDTGLVRYSNASHEMPFVFPVSSQEKITTKNLEPLTGAPDPILGQDLHAVFREHTFTLNNDHAFIIHSDGIVECQNAEQEEFGERRLVRAIANSAHLPITELRSAIATEAQTFSGKESPDDDITVVVIRRNPAISSALTGETQHAS